MDLTALIVFGLTALLAVFGWGVTEYYKRQERLHQRKEERYIALLRSVQGFTTNVDPNTSIQKREEFLRQLDLCWLYCPPTVVRAGYRFLHLVREGERPNEKHRELSLGEFVLSIREDLMKRQQRWPSRSERFCASEFKLLKALPLDSTGPMGFTHIPFQIHGASKGQISHMMTPVDMTQKELERWQTLVQSGQWNYQDPPLDTWRHIHLQNAKRQIGKNVPTENADLSATQREQILSLSSEDLELDTDQFTACKWSRKEPQLFFHNDLVQSLPEGNWPEDNIVMRS